MGGTVTTLTDGDELSEEEERGKEGKMNE